MCAVSLWAPSGVPISSSLAHAKQGWLVPMKNIHKSGLLRPPCFLSTLLFFLACCRRQVRKTSPSFFLPRSACKSLLNLELKWGWQVLPFSDHTSFGSSGLQSRSLQKQSCWSYILRIRIVQGLCIASASLWSMGDFRGSCCPSWTCLPVCM